MCSACTARVRSKIAGVFAVRISTCSSAISSVCPSYGLPGIERIPTTRPSLAVTATDTFTPELVRGAGLSFGDALDFRRM